MPSADAYAVTDPERRSRRSQTGATDSPSVSWTVPPPVVARERTTRLLPGVTNTDTCRESALSDCRIVSPPSAQGSAFWREATLAMSVASPVAGAETNVNWSDVLLTSQPREETENVPAV